MTRPSVLLLGALAIAATAHAQAPAPRTDTFDAARTASGDPRLRAWYAGTVTDLTTAKRLAQQAGRSSAENGNTHAGDANIGREGGFMIKIKCERGFWPRGDNALVGCIAETRGVR